MPVDRLADLDALLLELEPLLDDLDRERSRIAWITGSIFAVLVLLSAWLSIIAKSSGEEFNILHRTLVFSLLVAFSYAFVIVGLGKKFLAKQYTKEFKQHVISGIVAIVDESLAYEPYRHLSRATFDQCALFSKIYNDLSGDDLVHGKLGDTQVFFSELRVTEIYIDSKGNRRTRSIFKGLMLVASFNKPFRCRVGSSQMVGKHKVEMDDPEFEKVFDVYTNDPTEAFYVLSNSLLRRLTDFEAKTKHGYDFSMIDNKLFIAIPYLRELLEPPLFKSLFDTSIYEEYLQDLQLFAGVVEDLNLNTRIWKEVPAEELSYEHTTSKS